MADGEVTPARPHDLPSHRSKVFFWECADWRVLESGQTGCAVPITAERCTQFELTSGRSCGLVPCGCESRLGAGPLASQKSGRGSLAGGPIILRSARPHHPAKIAQSEPMTCELASREPPRIR